MAAIEREISVNASLRMAYNQWTQFEEFPKFMEGVQEVHQLGDKRLHWKAEIGGRVEEWYAEITEQRPDQRIVWRSTSGAKNIGMVTFEPINENTTRVKLQIEYDPEGFVENVGDTLGIVESRVAGDLERFKDFIEARLMETGGWRGSIGEPQR